MASGVWPKFGQTHDEHDRLSGIRQRYAGVLRVLGLLSIAPLLSACGTDPPSRSTGPLTGPGSKTYVDGTITALALTDARDVASPVDLSAAPPSILLPRGGSYDSLTCIGEVTGHFSRDGIPDATTYLLKVGTVYYETAARTPTLVKPTAGRSDRRPAAAGTTVDYLLTDMTARTDPDEIFFVSTNAGVSLSSASFLGSSMPGVGATSITASIDHSKLADPTLLDGTKGDSVTVLHATHVGSTDCVSAVDYFTTPSLTMKDGASVPLTGSFSRVAQSQSLNVSWKPAFYEAYRITVHPSAKGQTQVLRVEAFAAADRFGPRDQSSAVPLVSCLPKNWITNEQALAIPFGNPLPARFLPLVFAGAAYEVSLTLGNASPLKVTPIIRHWHPAGTAVIAPPISPVRNIRVSATGDPADAGASDAGVGATPVIQWDAPSLGRPTRYVVSLRRLAVKNGQTVEAEAATFVVASSGVRVPPGVIVPGESYYVAVRAGFGEGRTPDEILEKDYGPNGGEADAISDPFTP